MLVSGEDLEMNVLLHIHTFTYAMPFLSTVSQVCGVGVGVGVGAEHAALTPTPERYYNLRHRWPIQVRIRGLSRITFNIFFVGIYFLSSNNS